MKYVNNILLLILLIFSIKIYANNDTYYDINYDTYKEITLKKIIDDISKIVGKKILIDKNLYNYTCKIYLIGKYKIEKILQIIIKTYENKYKNYKIYDKIKYRIENNVYLFDIKKYDDIYIIENDKTEYCYERK